MLIASVFCVLCAGTLSIFSLCNSAKAGIFATATLAGLTARDSAFEQERVPCRPITKLARACGPMVSDRGRGVESSGTSWVYALVA